MSSQMLADAIVRELHNTGELVCSEGAMLCAIRWKVKKVIDKHEHPLVKGDK